MLRPTPARTSAEALLGELVRETVARVTDPVEAGIDRHHREIIQRLAAEIRESPAQARTVVESARVTGYSIDHFSRIFAKITGQRPQDWVIEARLVRARQLLAETVSGSRKLGQVEG